MKELPFNRIEAWKQFLEGQVRTIRNHDEYRLHGTYKVTSKYANQQNEYFGQVMEIIPIELYQYANQVLTEPMDALEPYWYDSGFDNPQEWLEAVKEYHHRAVPLVTSKADLKRKTYDLLLVKKL